MQNWQHCKIGSIDLKIVARFGISDQKLQSDHKPYRTLQNLTTQVFFIMTLQSLTVELLWNLHKERVIFQKNLRLRQAINPFILIPLNYFWLDHPPEVENLMDIACHRRIK